MSVAVCRSTGVVSTPPVEGVDRVEAHPATAVAAPVRGPLPCVDGWDLPSIRWSTGGSRFRLGVSATVLFPFQDQSLGAKHGRDLHPIRPHWRWRGLL